MRIAFNAHLLAASDGYRRAGVSRYIERLLGALPHALAPADELVVYARRDVPAPDPILDQSWHLARFPTARPPARILWEQTALPLHAWRDRASVLHGPVNVVPLLTPCPTVVTVHDLAFLHHPGTLPAGRRRYLTAATRMSVRRAARVIAVSESTKQDVVALCGVDPARVTVVPLAADPVFRPIPRDDLAAFLAEQGIVRPYILYVGTLEPRKNVPTLLRAFATIRQNVPHDLILVGGEGWMIAGVHETLRDLKLWDRVRLAGYAAPDALPCWYAASDLFVYPSLYEGFGLPPLEAMACGAPVIVSDAASLPEVVGDAGLLVPPGDVETLAEAMLVVLTERGLAAELRRRGPTRAAGFSWERTAEETAAVYRQVAP